MPYRAVIFDLDGTLLDTLEDLADAANRVLAENALPTHPVEAYRYFIGEGVYVLMTRALPADRRDPDTIQAFADQFVQVYDHNWKAKTRPYPGIPELLDQLTARGIPLGVNSNKPHAFTLLAVQELLPAWSFAAVLGQAPERPRKPDPAGALEIARQIGFSPGEFLYVGDSSVDMQTARAAGMHATGVTWGFRTPEELLQNGAQVLVHHPRELLPLLVS